MNTTLLAISIYIPVILYVLVLILFVLAWPVKPWVLREREDDPNHRITKE